MLGLTEPRLNLDGTATQVRGQEEQIETMVDTLYIRLAEVTGREVDEIRADARRGRFLTVPEAVAYGLLDGQAGRAGAPWPAGWAGLKHQSALQAPAAFIRANTWLTAPPMLPEIRLYLARDAFGLWERIERDTGQDQLPPPFWAFPWAGGQALARYLLDHPGQVRGRAVLDLASGSGLVAIAAALAGAASVTPSETDAARRRRHHAQRQG